LQVAIKETVETSVAESKVARSASNFKEYANTEKNLIRNLDEANFSREIDSAIDNSVSHNFYELPAKNPTTGEGLIKVEVKGDLTKSLYYQDNLTFKGIEGFGNNKVQVRTHSPNPNAPQGSYSNTNYTTQINSTLSPKKYRMENGLWKPLNLMNSQEITGSHYK
jgi:hypothetical protein